MEYTSPKLISEIQQAVILKLFRHQRHKSISDANLMEIMIEKSKKEPIIKVPIKDTIHIKGYFIINDGVPILHLSLVPGLNKPQDISSIRGKVLVDAIREVCCIGQHE